jgi:hypothetical protein
VGDLLPYLHGTTVNGTRSPTDIDLDNLNLKELRAYSVYSVRETRHKNDSVGVAPKPEGKRRKREPSLKTESHPQGFW